MNFCEVYKAGESGYYAERQRGTIDVFEDNQRYVYDASAFDSTAKFKLFAWEVFSGNGRKSVKIIGRYPTYQIETTV